METSVPAPPAVEQRPAYIAPWWHTVLLLVFLLGFSALGSAGHQGLNHTLRMKLYVSTIAMEWLLVLFIVWGLRRNKQTTVSALVGGRWTTVESFLIDIVVAFGFWIVVAMVLAGIGFALHMADLSKVKDMEQRIGSMLPDGRTEIITWLCLCATAGFCEEVIFRGYFQKQFGILLGSVWGGIAVQAMIFGGSHAYEGWRQMIRIAVFGFMFGVLAWWRKSLRPGMMAHFAQDSIAGLMGRWAIENANKVLPK